MESAVREDDCDYVRFVLNEALLFFFGDEFPVDVLLTIMSYSGEIDKWVDFINGTSLKNDKPLIIASRHGNGDIIRLLARYGVDLDATDEDGRTALMYAILHCPKMYPLSRGGFRKCRGVETLIDLNADVLMKDKNDRNAIDYIMANRKRYYLEYILKYHDDAKSVIQKMPEYFRK